jgi:hypothetical protein
MATTLAARQVARLVPELEAHPDVGMVYGNSLWWYSWTGDARTQRATISPPWSRATGHRTVARYSSGSFSEGQPRRAVRGAAAQVAGRAGRGSEEQFRGTHEDIVLYAKLLIAAR